MINPNGISADPAKTEAIQKMRAPTNVSELGMINQLNKFSSNVASLQIAEVIHSIAVDTQA